MMTWKNYILETMIFHIVVLKKEKRYWNSFFLASFFYDAAFVQQLNIEHVEIILTQIKCHHFNLYFYRQINSEKGA